MNYAAKKELYQPGQTLLHRFDPRLKVLSSLLLIMLAFAATAWSQLIVLAVTVSVAVRLISPLARPVWHVCWMLRWLFVFTVMMHLLFSSGRTLWGLGWLSLDGLLIGSRVCAQMLLAVIVSTLIAATTSSEVLAKTFGWFVRPLHWLGCRTDEWQKIVLLSMTLIPVVQEEIRASGADDGPVQTGRAGRWSVWIQNINDFLLRLVNRGDAIAHQIAANEDSSQQTAGLSPLMPMALLDQLFLLTFSLLMVCYWFLR